MALNRILKNVTLSSVVLSISDVQQMFDRLLIQVRDQADLEIAALLKPENESEEDFLKRKAEIKSNVFRVTVNVNGEKSSIFGDEVSIFTSANRPVKIISIYMTNITAYQGAVKQKPINNFELLIDFSKPPLLDAERLVSSPTPNNSHLNIEGERDAWVAAVSDAVLGVTENRRTKRSLIHKGFSYDTGLLILGVPLALYFCWKASGVISEIFSNTNEFVVSACYVYIFLVCVWMYRILFGYTKRAFPTVELSENKDASGTHRVVWGGQFAWV
jgi:hypothetical protein